MTAVKEAGNLETVREALVGITGVDVAVLKPLPESYLVLARMNHELDTVDSLRRNYVPAYWPSYEQLEVKRERGKNRLVRRWRRIGLIPGYVFSEVDPSRDFELLLKRIVGALDIVRTFSGKPLLISNDDLQIVRRIEIGLNTPRPDKVSHTFKVGQKVRFVDDLVGRWPPGIIEKLAHDGRISVEVDLMGRKVPITVLPHQIERT